MALSHYIHMFGECFNYSINEVLMVFSVVSIVSFIIHKVFNLQFSSCKRTKQSHVSYGYGDGNGPVTWKSRFPHAKGNNQSPINISSRDSVLQEIKTPLQWYFYSAVPYQIIMWNDGHSVLLQPNFLHTKPTLSAGPLTDNYELVAMRFRWGANDYEGSEHTIDYVRYAMELQVIFVKKITTETCIEYQSNSLLIMSYLFQITELDNPYLQDIIVSVKNVKRPGQKTYIQPFPMSWLMPKFMSDFYMYSGSLTHPPCTEGVIWIIQPEPLAVSSDQVRQFRKICDENDQPILTNCRPIQCSGKREVYYYYE